MEYIVFSFEETLENLIRFIIFGVSYALFVYYVNNYGSNRFLEKKRYSYFFAFLGTYSFFILMFELLATIVTRYAYPIINSKEYIIYLVEKYPNEEDLRKAINENTALVLTEEIKKYLRDR